MPFPHHDLNWTSVADYLKPRLQPDARILAPDIFWWLFPKIVRYGNTTQAPDAMYDWAVIHKGELGKLSSRFLNKLLEVQPPVFANSVFVVFSPHGDDRVPEDSSHLISLRESVAHLPDAVWAAADTPEPILPDPREIANFALMSDAAIVDAMDRFWTKGGYVYETLRDQAYYHEIDRFIGEALASAPGTQLLDIACGTGRLQKLAAPRWQVTGIDFSRVAIEMARSRHAHLPNFRFEIMNAQQLELDDASFDVVLFVDAIEHVRDAAEVMRECVRVLRPGGRLLTTVANSQGLNQIMMRKLGYPAFVTNYQHIREFDFAESQAMLRDAGFDILDARGIFLYPYWGIPGIDEVVRHLTDHDAEIVELMRVLGERVGPEYAYAFSLTAVKTA